MKTFLAVVGGIVFFPAWIAAWGIWNAFVLTKLWWWFVVPTFHSGALSIPLAYGLTLIFTFLTRNYHKEADDSKKKVSWGTMLGKSVGTSVAVPASALLVGWIAHLFV